MNKDEIEYDLARMYTTGKMIELGINITFNDVEQIQDIDTAVKLLNSLTNHFKLGMDTYDGCCSGDVIDIRKINDDYISFFTKDNNCFFMIKFKSFIIFNPKYDSNMSPIFILECDDDVIPQNNKNDFIKDDYSIYRIHENSKVTYKYYKRKIFCFFNIQSLSYENLRDIIYQGCGFTGEEVVMQLKVSY